MLAGRLKTGTLALILALSVLSGAWGMVPRKSEETGMVRVLYIGEPVGGPGPYRFMDQDPFLDMTPVQATTAWYETEIIKRSLRIYMPRNYRDLTSKEDVIILSDANRDLFAGRVLKWFSDGVVEDGMGLLMTGGRESFGAYFGMPDWTPTSVGGILPVASTRQENGPDGKVAVLRPENVFMASLPWESIGGAGYFYGCNPVRERQGAESLAQLVPHSGESNPLLVWWDIEEGRTFAMTSDWTPAGANDFLEWEYYPDYAVNLALFIASAEIPADPIIVHRIRKTLETYRLKRDFVLAMIEFIAKFGANPSKVEEMLSRANQGLRTVDEKYVAHDFEESLLVAEGLVEDLDQASEAAFKLKNQALLWVYVVEWSVTTATSMIAGVVIWALMVKRKLYREVASTRSG